MNIWASQAWLEAFPDVMMTPAQIGLIEGDVGLSPTDRAAWLETIKMYVGNRDQMTNSYNPARIGTVLKVFQSEKKRLERESNNGHSKSEREKSAERGYTAVSVIDELRRQGQAVSGGSDEHYPQDAIVIESTESH